MPVEDFVDSGPLLETCTAAGATLVAIVGGLLVARYVTLESELQAAADRVTEATDRLDVADRDRDAALAELHTFDVEWELDDDGRQMEILAAARGGVPLGVEKLREQADLDSVPDEIIGSVLMKWNAEARRVIGADSLWDEVPDGTEHESWADFKRGRNLDIDVDELWQAYYDALVEHKEKEAHRGLLVRPIVIPEFAIQNAVWRPEARKRLAQLHDEAAGRAAALKAELRLAEDNKARISRPPGLVLGLLILAFLTVTSVVVPVLYLAPAPAQLSYGEAAFVVASFFLGILVLFGYMAYHVYRLRSLSRARVDQELV